MLDGVPIVSLTPAALCGIFVLLLFTGRVVARNIYEEKVEECARWREAYETERDARQVSDLQTVELLELAKTTHALISAIVRTKDPEQSGGSDVVVTTQRPGN